MSEGKALLEQMLYDGKAVEMADAVCTDLDCGGVKKWVIDPKNETWDDAPDYVECGRGDCDAPAKVFKDEAVLQQDDRTPGEIASEIYEHEQQSRPQP